MSEEQLMQMDEETAAKMATGISAGMAAVDFLVEIAEALELDPKIANIDAMLERIGDLIETEKGYDKLKDLVQGEDQ